MSETVAKRLHGRSVFSGNEIELTISDGLISGVRETGPAAGGSEAPGVRGDSPVPCISPGFFDIQVNGYHGSDYSLDDLNEAHLRSIDGYLAAAGTTQYIPTIVTSPQQRLLKNLELMAGVFDSDPGLAAAIPGIHIEGPYVSEIDGPRGAHDSAYVRDPDYAEFAEWQAASGNRVRLVTLAPERRGALEFIEKVTAEGVRVGIGHSAAEPEDISRAVAAGASLSTHLGNGSHATVPRLRNYIWEQLACDDLWAGMISDGFHLPASVVKVFARAKGLSSLILVSDAALLGGFEPGIYKWGNLDVEVFPDGHLGLPGTSMLAGAAHLLDWSMAHFHRFTGVPLGDAVRLCSENPARFMGADGVTTSLRVGEPANLTLFSYPPAGKSLRILRTLRLGEEVYAAPDGSDTPHPISAEARTPHPRRGTPRSARES